MKRLFTLMCGVLFVHFSYAQWTYTVNYNADVGNPGGVNTGDDFESITSWNILLEASQAANLWSPSTAIPFAFDYYGTPVTHLKASANGLITFDTATTVLPNANVNLPTATLPNSTMAVWWDEFTNAPSTGTNDRVVTKTYGTAPNRQFWIKWFSFEMGNPFVSFNYFAAVLEESSNKIYLVDMYSSTSPSLSLTVGLQLDANTAVQFGDSTLANSGNGSTIPDNDYYEFCPLLLVPDDAGIASLINPTIPVTPGMQAVDVTLQNFGTNNLDTVDIAWEVDGMAQASVGYGTTLTPGATAAVNLGMYNFASGITNLKFWTSSPNGLADGNPANDTLEIFVCDPLSGVFTVGGAGADFATVIEAVDALTTCGISGSITFNIAPGTYDGGVTIPAFAASSATNTITFDGGSASAVTVTAANGAVFFLEGADYVTLTNMTLEHTGTTDAFGVRLADTANHNTISNNTILMDATGISDVVGIVATASATSSSSEGNNANYTMIMNNTIVGGDVGIRLEGAFNANNVGNQIIDNDLSLTDFSGISVDDQDSILIMGNYIHDVLSVSGSDGIFCSDVNEFAIMGNEVYATDWGIQVTDGFDGVTPINRGRIINNMVRSTTDYGIYLDDVFQTDIFHNTSYGEPAFRVNDIDGSDIRNNIFVSDNDFAFETLDVLDTFSVDFNVYESGGTDLVDAGPTNYADLAAWQAAEPTINANSLEGDPGFVSGTDLHVLFGLANDVGDNSVGVPLDVDGDTRPQAPSTTVDIGADEFTPLNFDATVSELLTANGGCGDSATIITVVFTNQGATDIDSMDISVEVSGSLTQTISATYLGLLPTGASDTIDVGAINTFAGGTFDLLAYTQLVGEQDASNDTMMYSIMRASSAAPTGMALSAVCEGDSTMLVGMGEGEYVWFDSLSGGNLLGQGDTFQTGPILAPTTFYVGLADVPDSLSTTFVAGNGCTNGNMFDIMASSEITINALTISPNTGSGSVDSLRVWYIPNNTYVGNETTPASWTLLDAQTYTSMGDGTLMKISISPLTVPAGSSYAIYVQADLNYTTLASAYNNADLSITTGAGFCTAFSPIAGRTFNGTIHYLKAPCTLDRTAVDVMPDPAATAGFSASSVEFDLTIVDQASDADSVFYDYGDGTTGTDTAHTYAAVGMYTVCQVATNDCGSDTTCMMVTITCTAATAGFTAASTELEATFTSLAMNADSVSYDYGDGTTGSDSVHTYPAAGTYTVCQIATNACEPDTVCLEVMITCTAPTAGLSVMNAFLTIAITNSESNADSVVYDYGDGNTGTDTSYTYAAAGVYTVCQIAFNDCDTDTSCAEIAVFAVGLDQVPGLTELSVFPNPNNGQFSVEAFLDRSEAFSMELHTIRGQLVYQKDLGNTNGSIQEQINVQHLSKGVYFLRIQVGLHALTQKITITE